eukprot:8835267-Lingulodinium_polyedra.AAC.1
MLQSASDRAPLVVRGDRAGEPAGTAPGGPRASAGTRAVRCAVVPKIGEVSDMSCHRSYSGFLAASAAP